MTRPNVLFITIDQWRADSLSCAGHPCAVTPNIDRLAERGSRFTHHFAQAAPCGPSRASLLTGLYAHNHRSIDNGSPLDANLPNLALEMRAAGYTPTLFGYTDTTVDPRTVAPDDPRLRTYEGVLDGFEVEVLLDGAALPWLEWLGGHGYDVTDDVWDLYNRRDGQWGPAPYASEHTEAAFLAERFIDWETQQDEPWFAHVTFLRPHPPYFAPEPWNTLIDPASVPMPARHDSRTDEADEHQMVAGALMVEAAQAPRSESDTRMLRATYWGMLAEVDEKVGWILNHLEEAGHLDDTLVVLTSDHGEQLGDHWLIQKLGFFDASYHVPLIISGPGASVGVVESFTESIDLMPTMLDAVGASVPARCDGHSLSPLLAGVTPIDWRDAVHWEWDFRWLVPPEMSGLSPEASCLAVIRDRHGKYVHFAGMDAAFYDLDHDPDELNNIAERPDLAEHVLHYAQRLLSWQMRTTNQELSNLRATPAGMTSLNQ